MLAILIIMLIIIIAMIGVGAAIVIDNRKIIRTWGADEQELEAKYPADQYVADARLKSTRAATIETTTDKVWPWIAQMGRGAGFYALDLFTNTKYKSADYLLDIPKPRVGDRAPLGVLEAFEKDGFIVWRKKPFKLLGVKWDICISYVLQTTPSDETRLIAAVRASIMERSIFASASEAALDVIDSLLVINQLTKLKKIIESYSQRKKGGLTNMLFSPNGHQRYACRYAQSDQNPPDQS